MDLVSEILLVWLAVHIFGTFLNLYFELQHIKSICKNKNKYKNRIENIDEVDNEINDKVDENEIATISPFQEIINRRKGPLRIALAGKARAGKDTAANRIIDAWTRHGAIRASFAAPLYLIMEQIQLILRRDFGKDGPLLQKLATLLRDHYGDSIFADHLVTEVIEANPDSDIIISDLRHKVEIEKIAPYQFITIRAERVDRPIDRDPRHKSEVDLDDATMNFTIHNNGTIEEYNGKIDAALFQICENMQ